MSQTFRNLGKSKAEVWKVQGWGWQVTPFEAAYVDGIGVEPGQDIERELPRGSVIYFWETTEDF